MNAISNIFARKNNIMDNRLEQQEQRLNRILNMNQQPKPINESKLNNLLKLSSSKNNSSLFKVQIDQSLPIFEQAYQFFGNIKGMDDIKRSLYLDLIADTEDKTGINDLLNGVPGCGKTLFLDTIRSSCNDVVYIDLSLANSAAGIIQLLKDNMNARIIVFDEVDKAKRDIQPVLLNLLQTGEVHKVLKGERINFKMNALVFGATNSIDKLTDAFKSRFTIYNIPEYTDAEFIDVVTYCLNGKVETTTAVIIAKVLLAKNMKNVRLAIRISKKMNNRLSEDDIITVIEDVIKRSTVK